MSTEDVRIWFSYPSTAIYYHPRCQIPCLASSCHSGRVRVSHGPHVTPPPSALAMSPTPRDIYDGTGPSSGKGTNPTRDAVPTAIMKPTKQLSEADVQLDLSPFHRRHSLGLHQLSQEPRAHLAYRPVNVRALVKNWAAPKCYTQKEEYHPKQLILRGRTGMCHAHFADRPSIWKYYTGGLFWA